MYSRFPIGSLIFLKEKRIGKEVLGEHFYDIDGYCIVLSVDIQTLKESLDVFQVTLLCLNDNRKYEIMVGVGMNGNNIEVIKTRQDYDDEAKRTGHEREVSGRVIDFLKWDSSWSGFWQR